MILCRCGRHLTLQFAFPVCLGCGYMPVACLCAPLADVDKLDMEGSDGVKVLREWDSV